MEWSKEFTNSSLPHHHLLPREVARKREIISNGTN
jgi:hypothetical protein